MDAPSPEDYEFALSHTRVLRQPIRRIDTFGSTRFEFELLSEPMDGGLPTRVRRGSVDAMKPKILVADHLRDFSLEGFGEEADNFREFFEKHGEMAGLLQYGMRLRRNEVVMEEFQEPLQQVEERVVERAQSEDDPLLAVLVGVEQLWELSLIRFALELVQSSRDTNLFDFKRKGLL